MMLRTRISIAQLIMAIGVTVSLTAVEPVRAQTRRPLARRPAAQPVSAKVNKPDDASGKFQVAPLSALEVARQVDQLIAAELADAKVEPTGKTKDEDFLRRVTFDLTGTTPATHEVALFGLNPDPQKRAQVIDKLLQSEDYARNWSQYWREVIYSRATDPRSRITQRGFEDWLQQQFAMNTPWDEVASALLTAKGDVLEEPTTALIFAQGAEPEEIASEASRIFLGIQIQCANCHDHPSDKWKREQFHELAAFFPRISLRPKMNVTPRSFEVASVDGRGPFGRPGGGDPRELTRNPERLIQAADRNGDGKITRAEAQGQPIGRLFDLLLRNADADKDGALTAAEIKAMPLPEMAGRGSLEHYMPNLDDPSDRGQQMTPAFFINDWQGTSGLDDLGRRELVAGYFTSKNNPWFARALVNRLWGEMLGRGFYMPIDDMGPERSPSSPAVLNLLADQFAANNYDVRWLFRAIANSETYQRQLLPGGSPTDGPAFAGACPTRLRSDQLYNALLTVLGVEELGRSPQRPGGMMGPRQADNSPRGQFNTIFGFDPSTPQDEIMGTVPQALFFMNGPLLNNLMRGSGETRLGRILREFPDNDEALTEMYLLVLSREPTAKEREICHKYLKDVPRRQEAFEDLLWSLLNSSEFQTKR